jgi:copper(I)-binding protein
MRFLRARLTILVGLAAALLAGSTACGTTNPTQNADAEATGSLTVLDPWVKAADEGMTAVFGTLVNNSSQEVTVVSAASPISPVEIHEVVMSGGAMTMREKEEGITIPAGGSHVLEPGGDHLMLMELSQPVRPGDEVHLTLTLATGETHEFVAVSKPFAGAEETYRPHQEEHS